QLLTRARPRTARGEDDADLRIPRPRHIDRAALRTREVGPARRTGPARGTGAETTGTTTGLGILGPRQVTQHAVEETASPGAAGSEPVDAVLHQGAALPPVVLLRGQFRDPALRLGGTSLQTCGRLPQPVDLLLGALRPLPGLARPLLGLVQPL